MILTLLLSASLVFTEADADFALASASNLVTSCTPRDAGTIRGRLAANWILDETGRLGVNSRRDCFQADALVGNRIEQRSFCNIYCEFLRSPDAPWVIFISHFDTKPGVNCPGANDGASTTGLLIALASALNDRGLDGKANVMLVWADGEECISSYDDNDGFWGSKRAAAEVRSRGLKVRAVICLDMLGDRHLNISIPSNGTEALRKIACVAASRTGFSADEVHCIPELVKDDHVAFLEAGYPAIDLIDFEYGSAPGLNDWWHTAHDTPDKLCRNSLLRSGRLVVELLNVLSR